ncbi:probable glutathione S-transferase [Cicer arietinum]|uniref:Glutathione-dependent dehydroascorbate reductase n=1 Tax=Cicer arietinum TaxID=3827 RepID=A0A1S2XXM9_CICAR|nr:probable glutathione S-transferase [Cicer arietinum]
MAEVKLHGFWYSPFTLRVVWTLNLKDIPYENIEEDRFNKSPQLLQYNPVHKKTPVLVHDGKPICESMIIVEYIDEIWPQNSLLPADPYDRAQARFWVKYIDEMISTLSAIIRSKSSEDREKAKENLWERLGVVEDQCLKDENKFYGGDNINIVDIALGSFVKFIEVLEITFKVEILQTERFPHLHLWFNNFKDVQVIKENTPHQEKFVAFLKPLFEKILASS